PEGSFGALLYRALGGPLPGRGAAYVATAAIALACVCSVIGFVLFTTGHAAHEHKAEQLQAELRALRLQRSGSEHTHKAKADTKLERLPTPKGDGVPDEESGQGEVGDGKERERVPPPRAEAEAQAQKKAEAGKGKDREQLTRDIAAKEKELEDLEGEWKGRVP